MHLFGNLLCARFDLLQIIQSSAVLKLLYTPESPGELARKSDFLRTALEILPP